MQYFFRKKVHRYLTDNDVRKIVENALYSNIKDCISRIELVIVNLEELNEERNDENCSIERTTPNLT